jgi:hypothetical protein
LYLDAIGRLEKERQQQDALSVRIGNWADQYLFKEFME